MNSSELKPLTRDGKLKQDPVFTSDGNALVYAVQESPTLLRLMKLDRRTGLSEPMHAGAITAEYEASFAKDGSAYAFVQNRANLSLSMVIRDTTTKQDYAFTPGGGFSGLRKPAFRPDGQRIAVAVPTPNGGQMIITLNRRGEDRQTLVEGGINNGQAWSPDGKSLAFISSRGGHFDLYKLELATGKITLIPTGIGLKQRPTWSPDSQWIAFTINREGAYRIARIHPDGKGMQVLTGDSERDDYPCYTPDGKKLIYVRELRGKRDLVEMGLESE